MAVGTEYLAESRFSHTTTNTGDSHMEIHRRLSTGEKRYNCRLHRDETDPVRAKYYR